MYTPRERSLHETSYLLKNQLKLSAPVATVLSCIQNLIHTGQIL